VLAVVQPPSWSVDLQGLSHKDHTTLLHRYSQQYAISKGCTVTASPDSSSRRSAAIADGVLLWETWVTLDPHHGFEMCKYLTHNHCQWFWTKYLHNSKP